MKAGDNWVVALALEPFVDRVHQDTRMSRVKERVADRRVLKRSDHDLEVGALTDAGVQATGEGTPQGGPWSPL